MITEMMTGRLGNQMFQYASMRALQEKYYPNEKINFSFDYMKYGGTEAEGFRNQLMLFNINKDKIIFDKKVTLSLYQKVLLVKYFVGRKILKLINRKNNYEDKKRIFEQKIQEKYNKKGLFLFSYGYYPFKASCVKNKLFLGFFESPKYFDDIKDILLREFEPVMPPKEKNKMTYKLIESSESVCVSVRRGDYVGTKFEKGAYICTKEYFDEALSEIKKRVKNPKFVVFSDDIEWVKGNMQFPVGTIYEDGNDSVDEKLRLMYSCKHFIISNSTFSWWAQYLSRNKNKVVIAPDKWRKIGYNNRDLYEMNWVLIKTGGNVK